MSEKALQQNDKDYIVWDNAAILSPASAKELGVENKDVVKIAAGDRSIEAAVWIVPGQADHSVALTLGWGRTKAGRIGNPTAVFDATGARLRRAPLTPARVKAALTRA